MREAGRFRAEEGRRSHRPATGGDVGGVEGGAVVTCWPKGDCRGLWLVLLFPLSAFPFKGFEYTISHTYFGRPV